MAEKAIDFEKTLEELENIVEMMEEEELSLDQSIKFFEKGSKLVTQCTKKLNEAEKKVQILLKKSNGNESLEDYPLAEDTTF